MHLRVHCVQVINLVFLSPSGGHSCRYEIHSPYHKQSTLYVIWICDTITIKGCSRVGLVFFVLWLQYNASVQMLTNAHKCSVVGNRNV